MDYVNLVKDLAIVVGVPVFRSVAGWANAALEDGKVTEFEFKELAKTVIRVGSVGLVGYFGLDAAGVDSAALVAAASAFVLDKFFRRK